MHKNIWINWSIEFGPIILFFASLSIFGENDTGFVLATLIFTVATALALIGAFIRDKRVALFPIVSGAFVIVFGVLTVFYNEPFYFIIENTIYNGLFALVLFAGILRSKGLLKYLFGSLFDMTDEGWRILSFRWMIMFLILTISNEITWRFYTQEIWVMYKFFSTIVTILFGSYQIFLAKKYRNKDASTWGMRIINFEQNK